MLELKELNGVGPKNLLLLKKLGISNIEDLITYYPRNYNTIVRTNMNQALDGEKVTIDGILDGNPTLVTVSSKLKKINFRLVSDQNIYNVYVFNQTYLCRVLHYGMKITVIGKFDQKRNTITAQEVRLGPLPVGCQIESLYHTTEGLTNKVIRKMIMEALEKTNIQDYIPKYLLERYHFLPKMNAIREIHQPTTHLSYKKALQRLKYEELFLYLMKIQYLKQKREEDHHAITRKIEEDKLLNFIQNLPFSLTEDQYQTVMDIKEDLLKNKRMNRLVQGDVGSGKTIVAFIASYINYLAGYQTALMVPTELLARQHYESALHLFQNTEISVALLTSSIEKKQKQQIYRELKEGTLDFIIGTQALIQESLTFANLGLIITDEQHRFGVNQRNQLKNKGMFPDILSMSATPIPRTYALTLYGDMDVSNIKTKPQGRLEVKTYFKEEKQITEVLKMMQKELENHHQIYVIAPSIEMEEKEELNNVILLKEKMKQAFGKIATVEMIHGKMPVEAKNQIMSDFEQGNISILISTTVIEVGVNVPNASMIVIFNASFFGLSTLHQLRGRVGRSNIQSYCVLIAKEPSERLNFLTKTTDGFEISEYDFKTRGEGDLFGIKQSGEALLKLASIKKDFDLLVRVKKDVLEFTHHHLNPQNQELTSYLEKLEFLD